MIQTEQGWRPGRMCAACRKKDAKANLLRIIQEDGRIKIDREQTSQARGVYLCKNAECIAKAKKSRALSRAFKRQVEDAVYDGLVKGLGQ